LDFTSVALTTAASNSEESERKESEDVGDHFDDRRAGWE
jgi:hypothetical protein